ncbi:tagaturonate epimerase family protein [Dictyobacter arantiisoli]|uniref:Tagaturonate/fructuronate epimerase n=1 Tax=Dictyobacter arantiisoli TaxID=2014874 RepID=A0A5A5TAL2_9CHLR|nr:tagaturonate epimerase family protein [Dictyobacter arantiisoli]GCF08462.1 hypothetical protein KDI_20260 [Dictyobacter arantiisoli]
MASYHNDVTLPPLPGFDIYPSSIVQQDNISYFLVGREDGSRQLAINAPIGASQLAQFEGTSTPSEDGQTTLLLGPLNAHNAQALRNSFDWLRPSVQGLRTGIGLGDRLGLATPGHLRAVREVGHGLVPFPAQQSIREMSRTSRTAQQVMDDALWGIFAEGWRAGFGADADHLKTPQDIDTCLAAGYTFYTFDPGEYVDDRAIQASLDELKQLADQLPWQHLEDTVTELAARYLAQPVQCEDYTISFDETSLLRAAAKYGRAVSHVARMYRHLAQVGTAGNWEVEISVDETTEPTTHAEHVYIASELRRLGVQWISLAPRFVGQFEKGVDYIGDIAAFEDDIRVHAAIARTLGPYKISLHSGSDKFSIYAPAARQTRGVVHLKTAGTSYLEALRTIATLDPELLKEIYAFARQRYTTDRTSYHVSASLERAPELESLNNETLPELLEQFDAREILHVTFGSVLTEKKADGTYLFYNRLMHNLRSNPQAYAADLKAHFLRHIRPFIQE